MWSTKRAQYRYEGTRDTYTMRRVTTTEWLEPGSDELTAVYWDLIPTGKIDDVGRHEYIASWYRVSPYSSESGQPYIGENGRTWYRRPYMERVYATAPTDVSEILTGTLNAANQINDARARQIAIHELGHRFEHTTPTLHTIALEFLTRRTGPNRRRTVVKGETVLEGGFAHPYTGRHYDDHAVTEIISTGVEAVLGARNGSLVGFHHTTPDPEHRALILGLLASA